MRRALALAAVVLALAPGAAAAAPPEAGVSGAQAIAIASRLPVVVREKRTHPASFAQVASPVAGQWQVAFYSHDQEFVQVIVDAADGRVLGAYTGIQIAWTMARGDPGAFGRDLDALYIWLPLSLLFVAPFISWRRPLRMINLDLFALSFFSVSLAFFNHADIYQSVPLTYPPLVYLLARMLWLARAGAQRPALTLNVGVRWLAVGVVLLTGFRIGLNVVNSTVIDVGYANVVGAQKVIDGEAIYGQFPSTISRGDTYGPVSYEAYVPFVWLWGFSGTWDDLPAAHAAAIFFDLLALALLFALGWRIRGPSTGVVLAYAWAAYPFTAFALESNTNDALVAALVLAALLAATAPATRGAFAVLAGLAKFAPLALAPLLALDDLRERGLRTLVRFAVAFAVVGGLVAIPALAHNSLSEIYQRTIVYQADRSAPFSLWGLYGGLHGVQTAVQVLAVVLVGLLAVAPRRAGVVGLAACSAALLIAVELGATYWFYLYIPWFYAPAAVVLFGGFEAGGASRWGRGGPRSASGERDRRLALARLGAAR